jgi:AraC-like DNA-binding protein
VVLGTNHDDGSFAASAELRRRVAAYVAEHVEDLDLGVESIARAHYVSVRGLHRAFAGAGMSVGTLIRRLRMEHARQRLVDPRDEHLTVTEIAHTCGFADLPTFSHGFKQRYKESPSSYRRAVRRCPDPAGSSQLGEDQPLVVGQLPGRGVDRV